MGKSWWFSAGLVLLAVVVLYGVYQPGLSGGFVLDDERNIEANEEIQIESLSLESIQQAWQSGVTGGLGRPLSMLSFALTYYVSGPEPAGFKAANVYLHIVNTLLVWLLVVAIFKILLRSSSEDTPIKTKAGILAFLVSIIWALHPLHVSTVLYAVQRMTLLAASFTLAGLWLYIIWRQSLSKVGLKRWVLPPVITLTLVLGVLCKENAILLLGYIGVVEIFVFHGVIKSPVEQLYRKVFWCLFLIGLLAGVSYVHFFQEWFAGDYKYRNFSLVERLLTESRVMFTYIQWLIVPIIDQYGLFHDDIAISTTLFKPITTLLSVVGLIAIGLAAAILRHRLPWFGLGVGLFLIGHSLESSIIPLEIVFEHRNYLPSLGVVVVAILIVYKMIVRLKVRRRVTVSISVAFVLFLSSMTLLRAMEWSNDFKQMSAAVERHPLSARTQWAMAIWYLEIHSQQLAMGINEPDLYAQGRYHALLAAKANPQYASSYFGLILFHFQHSEPFPGKWIDELGERLQHNVYYVENDDYFNKLLDCYQSDSCFAEEGSVDFLYRKALMNQSLSLSVRARLLSGYSAFKYGDDKLWESAQLLMQSVELKPTKERYRNLVVLYLELKDKAIAEKYFEKFKSISDKSNSDEVKRIQRYVDKCCDIPLP